MRNVHKVDAKVINLPTEQLKEDRGYKFCGKPYLTFANPEDGSVSWQNDLFSVAFIADSVEVVLEKDGTELTAFGVTLDFPNQPDAVGFMIIWREVLLNHGAGCYKVKANYMLQGFEFTLHYGSFDLMPYSVTASESSIRVLGQYNDEVKMYGINFAGSSFARTFRVKGNLHNEQPNTEHGNILKGDDKFAKYRNHGQISYDLETAPLVACELDPLFEIIISSNKIYVSDFNSANFRQYRDIEVILRGDEEISYGEQFGHERQLFAPFKQKNWLVESKYSEGAGDGQIFTSGLDFDNLVCPVVCADANYIVQYDNGTLIEQGTIPSGGSVTIEVPNPTSCQDANYTLTDSLGNVLETGTIASGGSATITAPDGTNNINKSNGALIQSVSVASGAVVTTNIADSVITVNSASYTSLLATDSLNIPIVDSNGDAVATTVVGSNVQVDDLPCGGGGVTRSTATLLKTGQTISYRTGDDGDLQAGRVINFFTLDSVPIHNDSSATINTTTNRFTDTLGGQTYANNIVLDWSTWNGTTLLGWARDSFINNLITWNDAIDNALSYTNGIFVTGFRLPNDMELMSISYKGTNAANPQVLQYPSPYNSVFNITSNVFWSGTVLGTTGSAYVLNTSNGTFTSFGKTNTRRAIYARTFNLSLTNILS